MAPVSRAAGPSRRSWKDHGAVNQVSPASRWLKRIVVTGCGLAALAALVWLLLRPTHNVDIAGVSIGRYDVPKAPSIAFARQDLDAIKELDRPRVEVAIKENLTEADDLQQQLGPLLQGLAGDSSDVLILYVNGHGASFEGRPVLLASDYDPSGAAGRYEIDGDAGLLAALARSPAKAKLLLLDAGRLEHDSRAGMIVNEFPRLLDEAVAKLESKSNLWVLSANGFLERSHVSYTHRRSVFGHYVVAALKGGADGVSAARDGAKDGKVVLREFAAYVERNVAQWVWTASGGSETQTPQLLRAGKGRIKVEGAPDSLALLATLPASKPETSDKEIPDDDKAPSKKGAKSDKSQEKESAHRDWRSVVAGGSGLVIFQQSPPTADEPLAEKEKAEPAKPAADPADPAKPKPESESSPAATSGGGSGLSKPAKRRPVKPSAPVPTSRAPKELQPILERWGERDLPIGSEADDWQAVDAAPHLWRRLNETLLGYEQHVWAGYPLDSGQVRVLEQSQADLRERIASFAASRAAKSYRQGPDNTIVDAVRLRNRILYRLPYYWRWSASVRGEAAGEHLAQRLDALSASLSALMRLFDPATAAASGVWLEDVRGRRREVEDEFRAVEEALADELDEASRQGDAYRLEGLLVLPLWTRGQRERIIEALVTGGKAFKEFEASGSLPVLPARRGWSLVERRAKAELHLAELVPAESQQERLGTLRRQLDAATKLKGDLEETVALRLKAYRAFGGELARSYAEAPGAIRKSAFAGEEYAAGHRMAEDLLRLLDARDAREVDARIREMSAPEDGRGVDPVNDVPLPPLGIDSGIRLVVKSEADRSAAGEASLIWQLISGRALGEEARVELQYSEAELAVYSPGAEGSPGVPVPPGKPQTYRTRPTDTRLEQSYRVRAANVDVREATVRVQATVEGEALLTGEARFTFAEPGRLEFFVRELAGNDGTSPDRELPFEPGGDELHRHVVLRPFAAGAARYVLGVKNNTGQKRELRYEFYALPAPPEDDPRPWPTPWPAGDRLMPGCRSLTGGLLPAEPATVEKEFLIPPPLPKPATPPAADPAATPAVAPVELPITHGLVLVVDDAMRGEKQMLWLEAAPQHPSAYVEEPEVWYDVERHQIRVRVRPLRGRALPPDGARIKLDLSDSPELKGGENKEAEILVAGDESAELYVVAGVVDREARIFISVDDYPRAFVYQVPRDGRPDRVRWLRDSYRDVRILEPADGTLLAGEKSKSVHVLLQADAPPAEFDDRDLQVQVRLKNGVKIRRFLTDRHHEARLLAAEPATTYLLEARVTDLELDLNTEAFPHSREQILARFVQDGRPLVPAAERTIVLDNEKPEINLVAPMENDRKELGAVLDVELEVNDLSGVKKVEVGFKDELTGGMLAPKPARSTAEAATSFKVKLPTKDLETPGDWTVMVKATDLVDNVSEMEFSVKFVEPKKVAPGGTPMNNSLTGKATYGDKPGKGVTITLDDGSEQRTAKADEQGGFSFADLPPGAYTITAKGIVTNTEVVDVQKVTVKPGPAPPAKVNLKLHKEPPKKEVPK